MKYWIIEWINNQQELISRPEGENIQIIAIDALERPINQYSEENVLREINKALSGFQLCLPSKIGISSGKWGCGVFLGDKFMKTIIQWIVASLVGKPVWLSYSLMIE